MNYLLFQKALSAFPVFSIKDIQKRFPDFDSRRLVEWQDKGYILKLRQRYYCLQEQRIDEHFLYFSANKIYAPSYVSFESALAYYQFIPEGVFTIKSATTRNTAQFPSPLGRLEYKSLKKDLFFGYKILPYRNTTIKIATPEKAILDYLYLSNIQSTEEIEELRLNQIQIREVVNAEKLAQYQRIFGSKILDKRVKMLKKIIYA